VVTAAWLAIALLWLATGWLEATLQAEGVSQIQRATIARGALYRMKWNTGGSFSPRVWSRFARLPEAPRFEVWFRGDAGTPYPTSGVRGLKFEDLPCLPLWPVLVLAGLVVGWVWWFRRPGPGTCRVCRYSLEGINVDRCPECGSPVAPNAGAAGP
jgi:hypothetical protein